MIDIKKAHAEATAVIIGILTAKAAIDSETAKELQRLLSWHCEAMLGAIKSSKEGK